MKIKNSNVAKFKDVIIEDKKISALYIKLKSVLSKNNKNSTYAVAVSGGPDSMALAFLLFILAQETKSKVYFLLVDHGIRKNSRKEALFVKKLLKKRGINLQILKNKKKIFSNIQRKARDIRYELLIKFCK